MEHPWIFGLGTGENFKYHRFPNQETVGSPGRFSYILLNIPATPSKESIPGEHGQQIRSFFFSNTHVRSFKHPSMIGPSDEVAHVAHLLPSNEPPESHRGLAERRVPGRKNGPAVPPTARRWRRSAGRPCGCIRRRATRARPVRPSDLSLRRVS